jgi:uncharacterized membrane protein YiaA
MHCNINAKGKAARLIIGVCLVGLGAIALTVTHSSPVMIGIALAVVLAGLFAVFEGWAGWCALRALGFKTRI